jgi:RNase P/RNase MRP subunit POP5
VKRRYLALTIDLPETCSANDFVDAIWDSIAKLYGEHGCSTVSMSLISFDSERKSAVLRAGHTNLEMVRTALASMTKIGGKPVAVHVLRISGTLKGLRKKT